MRKPLKGKDEKSDKRRVMESRGREGRNDETSKGGAATPLFFVSVASKGLSPTVSLLFATLAGRSISVAAKGLTGEFSEVWQGKALGDRKRRECPLPPAFL